MGSFPEKVLDLFHSRTLLMRMGLFLVAVFGISRLLPAYAAGAGWALVAGLAMVATACIEKIAEILAGGLKRWSSGRLRDAGFREVTTVIRSCDEYEQALLSIFAETGLREIEVGRVRQIGKQFRDEEFAGQLISAGRRLADRGLLFLVTVGLYETEKLVIIERVFECLLAEPQLVGSSSAPKKLLR